MKSIVIQFLCKDQPGIVARVTSAIFEQDGNIINLEQHVENNETFFMRVVVDIANENLEKAKANLRSIADDLNAKVIFKDTAVLPKVALLVSKELHCLADLLARYEAGELRCEVACIISNHTAAKNLAGRYDIPFHYLPVDGAIETQEAKILSLLEALAIDLVVLARYMRILSADFARQHEERLINIHHSFLPSFKGARPYHQAWEKGVKLIGATAHYVTAELDEGPIIAQDVQHISHHYSAKSLVEAGRTIEQRVLAEAVKAWLDSRIVVHGQRTIVFHP